MTLQEREHELESLGRVLAMARSRAGAGVAVAGEPGAGKTALVDEALARSGGLRVLRGGCDPLVTPRPLGPFRDIVSEFGGLDLSGSPAEVCDAVYAALRSQPTVLVVEDLHWVDAASVEVLRFLVRRLEPVPVVVVVTYPHDEIGPAHPARSLLGDFAVLDHLTTLRLDPLSLRAVEALLAGGPLEAGRVHEVTGGNPFFVTEVAKEPDRPLPRTVRDAVLARTTGITEDDLEVLQLAAAAPDRLDDRVLPALGVDLPTLRRLFDTGLLLRSRHGLVFRHELARLAVESTIPAGGATRLHARLLHALEGVEPRDPAVLTHHAVAAANARSAAAYAQDAAEEAARSGSHTEAVAFLTIALDNVNGNDPGERARLLHQLGYEQYMTSHLQVAIDSVQQTFPLWRRAGELSGLSAAHECCAVFEYYNARRPQAEDHAERATDFAREEAGLAYAAARTTRAYLAYHCGDYDVALECAQEAADIARAAGNEALALRTSVVMALVDLAQGRAGSRARAVEVIEDARAAGLDELASTGYSNLSYLDVEHRRLGAAERVLEHSLVFTVERDIPICNHWQTAVRSRLRFSEGRWSAAMEDADDALARSGMPLATLWPHVVSGLVSMRRDGGGSHHLEAAWDLAERLDEPLRRVPVLVALAERQWLTGTVDDRVTMTAPAELVKAAGEPATAWAAGDLGVWLRRLGIQAPVDLSALAEPHRLSLQGRHEEAAAWWHQTGAVFEEAMARSDSADLAQRIEGIEQLDLVGAVVTADRLRRLLRQEGVTQLPQRPWSSTRENPSGLTNRQLDVARLVARGLTNAEISERLYIAPKTTEHHVSAVLLKLGMSSRRAVVVQAGELGLA